MNLPRTALVSALAAALLAAGSGCQPQGPAPVPPSPTVEAEPSFAPVSPTPPPTPTAPPTSSPRPVAELIEKYQRLFFSELPRWGLGSRVVDIFTQTISTYGRWPDGAEYLQAETTPISYYYFDGSFLDSESLTLAVLFPLEQTPLSIKQIKADFGSSLAYQKSPGEFGLPYYTASLGDMEVQFLVEDDSGNILYVLFREPNVTLTQIEGSLRNLSQPLYGSLSPELRVGSKWELINNMATLFGKRLSDIQSALPNTELLPSNGPYIGTAYYRQGFTDLDSGIIYMDVGHYQEEGLCSGIHIPASLLFEKSNGDFTPQELSDFWGLPYWYSYYQGGDYVLPFSDLKLYIDSNLLGPTEGQVWITLVPQ